MSDNPHPKPADGPGPWADCGLNDPYCKYESRCVGHPSKAMRKLVASPNDKEREAEKDLLSFFGLNDTYDSTALYTTKTVKEFARFLALDRAQREYQSAQQFAERVLAAAIEDTTAMKQDGTIWLDYTDLRQRVAVAIASQLSGREEKANE